MRESEIQKHILLTASRHGTFFRNNVGTGWAGHPVQRLPDGSVRVFNARPLHAGLCVGSSDLIGFTPILITPEHVGQTLAVFSAVEVKTSTGTASDEQRNFIATVLKSGGFAGIARSSDDVPVILSGL